MITKHNVAATLVGTTNINNYNYIDTSVLYIDFEPSVFDNKPYRLAWDNDNGTLSFGLPDGGSIQINQEEFNLYITQKLKNKLLSYEHDELPIFDEIYELSKKAYQKFLDKNLINNVNLKSDIFIKVNEKSLMLSLDKNLSVVNSEEIDKQSKKYVRYETDIRLLKKLLMGPKFAHWNNAEIGSHLKFFRKPNIFERDIYASMCYFHC